MTLLRDIRLPLGLAGLKADPALSDGPFLRGDLKMEAGTAVGLQPGPRGRAPRIVLPALVEAHCHLDKCHTAPRLAGIGGDLSAAIAAQAKDKAQWDEADLRCRSGRGLAELRAAGCGVVRTHVDWTADGSEPLAWPLFEELAADHARGLRLDRAALVGIEQLADPELGPQIARRVAARGGTLGAFVFDQKDRDPGLAAAFRLADRFGLALDFHVDEGLTPGLDGLARIARAKLAAGFQGPVLCGHACSLINLEGDALRGTLDLLRESGLVIAALPTTNLYLQGRQAGTPDRRGLTRLRELHAAGVPVVVGSDNVNDAFCPVGRHDPMAALHLAVMAGHLDPPLEDWLPLVLTNGRHGLGLPDMPVIGATINDLRLSTAPDLGTLIAGTAGPPAPLTHAMEAAAA